MDAGDAPETADSDVLDTAARADGGTESSSDQTRVWLVERSYDDRNLITLVYATPDGSRSLRKERSATVMRQRGSTVTAAVDADETALSPVDESDRERYATEAERMRERHAPDDEV